jgi:hypothetical protein
MFALDFLVHAIEHIKCVNLLLTIGLNFASITVLRYVHQTIVNIDIGTSQKKDRTTLDAR